MARKGEWEFLRDSLEASLAGQAWRVACWCRTECDIELGEAEKLLVWRVSRVRVASFRPQSTMVLPIAGLSTLD